MLEFEENRKIPDIYDFKNETKTETKPSKIIMLDISEINDFCQ